MSEENKELQTPQEVILRYTHPSQQPQEVVCRYEQPTPMPGKRWREVTPKDTGEWQEAAKREKRHRRWPWLAALGTLAVIVAVLLIVWHPARSHDTTSPDEDSASSIVDIMVGNPTIPVYQGKSDLWLTCEEAHGEELTPQEVYAKVCPSTVTVVASTDKYSSIGTGIIMSEDGFILTNAHVISGGVTCWIALDNGMTYEAQLVGFDKDEDLAVLKAVDAKDLPAAEFGDSELAQVGDTVYAIGNPLGMELRGTLTDGIISAIDRDIQVDGKSMTVIQTNAALNSGNSGGPLINAYGQIIGINTLKMSNPSISTEASVEGLGFALPISTISFVANDIIKNGSFSGYPTIGVTVYTSADDYDGTCVRVLEVAEGFGAEKAGIKVDDIILAADGHELSSTADLLAVRRSHISGDTMTLTILRGGETFDVSITLMPDN